MIRCDLGHEHETVDAAVACVRVTKLVNRGSTVPSTRSLELGPVASTSGAKTGRPRVHQDNAARQRAYRDRLAALVTTTVVEGTNRSARPAR